jgi:Mg-chelatase subunit ChlD
MEYSKPKENENESNKKLTISVLQSQKLFNKNTAFVLSINSPDKIDRESNVDVLCVIDISGSMKGQKLNHVKLSLKSIISFMNPKDRLCIILFNDDANVYLDLNFMTEETKKEYLEKIEKITAKGGTNILSGLKKAIEILKEDKKNENNNEPMEEKRVKTIMLLSDGYDNDYDTEEIVDEIKKITKGQHLCFTLHTFGYGDDFDTKLMSKLALIRDGSFFTIEDINKIQEYFVNALGGCMSTIYNEVKINIKMLKDTFKLKKVFGQDKLYQFELKNNDFSFGIIQLISGKEYTFTFEIELPEIIQINENIFEVEIAGDNNEKYLEMGKYKIVGGSFSIADEEYLKNRLYETLDEAMKLKEEKKTEQMNLKLNEMKNWIEKNYEGANKSQYIKKLNEALGYMQDEYTFQRVGRTRITADIYTNQLKRGGMYSNNMQKNMISSMPK